MQTGDSVWEGKCLPWVLIELVLVTPDVGHVQEEGGWLAGQELITPDLTNLTQGFPSHQQEVVAGSYGHEEILRSWRGSQVGREDLLWREKQPVGGGWISTWIMYFPLSLLVLQVAYLWDLTSHPSQSPKPVLCQVSYSKMKERAWGRRVKNRRNRNGERLNQISSAEIDTRKQ